MKVCNVPNRPTRVHTIIKHTFDKDIYGVKCIEKSTVAEFHKLQRPLKQWQWQIILFLPYRLAIMLFLHL